MHVLCISQFYPPEMAAGGIRIAEMVPAWIDRGHDVSILTAVPNYPDGQIAEPYRWRLYTQENGPSGEKLHRVALVPASSGNLALRTLKFLSFGVTSVAFGAFLNDEPDVVVATSPPPTVGAIGYMLARRFRARFVFDVRDLWPETVAEVSDVPSPVLTVLHHLAGWLYRTADDVVVVSRAFEERVMKDRAPETATSPVFIPNGVDLATFQPEQRAPSAIRAEFGLPSDDLLLTYIGTFGRCQNLIRLRDGFRELGDRGIHVCLVGGGTQEEELYTLARRMDSLTVLERQPRERVPDLYAASDVGLVALRNTDVMETVLPSKMFEIMACRKPILLVGGGEARRVVDEAECGITVPAGDISGFVDATCRLKDAELRRALGSAGRTAVEETFNRSALARRYVDMLEKRVAAESADVKTSA